MREAVRAGIEPEVIPGVSALTFAVTASALPVDKFTFLAFPPVKSGRRRKFLNRSGARGRPSSSSNRRIGLPGLCRSWRRRSARRRRLR
ncbi:MAG: hypothetical protein L6W00_29705 [Lentisphaeria bacterium]|nr:MAG: hypothetical protein L6W00_29705 [Lentisphaeria bacterium]